MMTAKNSEIAVFGGGCFWCTEALFQELKGVVSVMPGYAGGSTSLPTGQAGSPQAGSTGSPQAGSTSSPQVAPPTYAQVSSGKTGHAEVIKIEYNPEQISFSDLLTVFFETHDPTTMNRQGADVGTQYRSVILYTSEDQKREAEKFIKDLNESSQEGKPIVTELKPLDAFYPADYYKNNADQPYCQIVINPKLEKLHQRFQRLLKK